MDKIRSAIVGEFGDTEKADQASGSSKDEVVRGQGNVRIVRNVLLIWLDNKINDSSDDCRSTIIQLGRVINNIDTFTDGDQCIQFINTITDNKACMIISGSLGPHIVPRVHNMSQVDSIFIFCDNQKPHEQLTEEWLKEWSKIKGVFKEISPICKALKKAARQCERNAIPMSFVATSSDAYNKNFEQLDPSFMYTQILKEILLSIEFEEKHIKEFIEYCCDVLRDDDNALNNIKKLEQKYRDKTPIWWYTREYLLYSMLNRALRLMNVDIIIKIGFFINNLHRHIEQLYLEQFPEHQTGETFTVYRGQGMLKSDFDQMTKTKGGLMSFNNFLSTSTDSCVARAFAESVQSNLDLVGILFVMTIDPSKSTTPFASITNVSHYEDKEDEVLFSMHTVFRIRDIKPMNESQRLFQVDLTLTSDNDKDLCELTEHIREETSPHEEGWYRLGSLLLKMGQFEKARQVYELILKQTVHDSEKGKIYNGLGMAKYKQGEYADAIAFYEKALDIYEKTLPPNHPNLAKLYSNIGVTYQDMSEYSKALSYHENALKIRQQSLPTNHSDLAMSYDNIGVVHKNMGQYSKALSSYEKALEILQKSLPANHPDLALSYNNIGLVYKNMGEYSKSLTFYEKALEIQQKSLPTNHPDLAMSYNNIGVVYKCMGECSKALSFYEKSLEIEQKTHPQNHSNLAKSYIACGTICNTMNKHSNALTFYEKALEIQQKSLPTNHPDLSMSYNNIGVTHYNMGEYSKALSFYERSLEIKQKTYPQNHPDLATSYINIGAVYDEMGEYSKAILSYEKALEIQQQSLPLNYPNLCVSYNNIGFTYYQMNDYSKARTFYERALDIGQRSLPSNHPHLQECVKNLEDVQKKL